MVSGPTVQRSMISKGIYTVEIDGKTVGFKFGMRASEFTEKETGTSISRVMQKINDGGGETTVSILHYFFGAACSYAAAKKEELPSLEQVEEYIDSMGLASAMKIFSESLGVPKNSPTPEVSLGK